jgi:hypothetical protein
MLTAILPVVAYLMSPSYLNFFTEPTPLCLYTDLVGPPSSGKSNIIEHVLEALNKTKTFNRTPLDGVMVNEPVLEGFIESLAKQPNALGIFVVTGF